MLAAVGLSQWIPVTAVLMFAMGIVGVLFMTTANTRLQLAVPGHMRGRVMGFTQLLLVGTTPIGAYVMGHLAEVGRRSDEADDHRHGAASWPRLCADRRGGGGIDLHPPHGHCDLVVAGEGPNPR